MDGRRRLDGDCEALDGEILSTAWRLATSPEDALAAQSRGLVDICRYFSEHREPPPAARHRPHVSLTASLDDIRAGRGGECADGVVLDGPSLASLVCDSVLHRVVMADSVILDYGTSTRAVSAHRFNALVVRDRHCRFSGCDRPPAWLDAHHVVHVEHGGATSASNCCLLCRRHHRRLHRPGWSAEFKPGGELVVTDPRRAVFTSYPSGHRTRPPPALFAA